MGLMQFYGMMNGNNTEDTLLCDAILESRDSQCRYGAKSWTSAAILRKGDSEAPERWQILERVGRKTVIKPRFMLRRGSTTWRALTRCRYKHELSVA